ncbi:MAG: hypothetical protein Q8P67_26485, partial [archaeon]|nr:hypothetical protein [archaeon]
TQSFSATAHDSSSSSPSSSSSTLNNSNNDLQSAGTPAPTDACHSQPQAASSAGFRREMFRRQRSSSSSMVRLSNPDHFVQHPKVIKSRFRPGPDLSPDALREDSPAVPSSPLKIRAPRKHRSLKSPRSSRSPRSPRGTNSKSPRSHRRSDSSGRSGSSSRSSSKSRNSSLDPFQVAEDRLSKRNHKSSKPASGDVLRSTAPDALQQALRMRQAERSAIPLSTSEDFKLTMHLAHDGTFTPNEESSQRASASVSQPTHSVTPAPEIEKKLYASGGAVPPACSCSTDPPTRSGSLFAIVRGRSRKKAPPEAAASVPSVSAVTCTLLDEETMVSAHSSDSEDSPARDASPSVSTDHPARDSSPSVSASTEQPPKKRVANLLRQHLLGLFGSDNKRA